jgi:hypothetical protein
MTEDIIQKIRNVAPSEIDRFEARLARRNGLTDDKIDKILLNTFYNIDKDRLNPSQSYAYQQISKRLQSR